MEFTLYTCFCSPYPLSVSYYLVWSKSLLLRLLHSRTSERMLEIFFRETHVTHKKILSYCQPKTKNRNTTQSHPNSNYCLFDLPGPFPTSHLFIISSHLFMSSSCDKSSNWTSSASIKAFRNLKICCFSRASINSWKIRIHPLARHSGTKLWIKIEGCFPLVAMEYPHLKILNISSIRVHFPLLPVC